MTSFNALQLALAAVTLGIAVLRLRVLWLEAGLDTDAFLDALGAALDAGEIEMARKITNACLPAWPARLAAYALAQPEQLHQRLELEQAELRTAAWRGRSALVTLARIAGPLALIGVILEFGGTVGETGLAALQHGLPLKLGIERSLLTFAIGLGTTLTCIAAAGRITHGARALERALDRVAATLEGALGAATRGM